MASGETCRCYPPPYTTDSPEICEAIGGTCMPLELEIGSGPQVPPSQGVYPYPSPLGEMRSGADCGQEISRVMHVPFGFDSFSVRTIEDPDLRPYIWEW